MVSLIKFYILFLHGRRGNARKKYWLIISFFCQIFKFTVKRNYPFRCPRCLLQRSNIQHLLTCFVLIALARDQCTWHKTIMLQIWKHKVNYIHFCFLYFRIDLEVRACTTVFIRQERCLSRVMFLLLTGLVILL